MCLIKILIIVTIITAVLVSQKFYLGLDDTFMGVPPALCLSFSSLLSPAWKSLFWPKNPPMNSTPTLREGSRMWEFFTFASRSLERSMDLLLCVPAQSLKVELIASPQPSFLTGPSLISQPLFPLGTLLKLPKSGSGWELLGKESPGVCLWEKWGI